MKRFINKTDKEILTFNCYVCRSKWETDEWNAFEIASINEGSFERHSKCDNCGAIAKYNQ